jgi:serine-type D-Ala-D-Ala carboxypeptidase (penicillin-binding protein 5/6)
MRPTKHARAHPALLAAALTLVALLTSGPPVHGAHAAVLAQVTTEERTEERTEGAEDGAAPSAPSAPAPEVTASGAVLWDPLDDVVLYDKEAEVGRPMASTTKIMTSVLALEAGPVDAVVTVSAAAAALGEATLNLRTGQTLPLRSLVAGLIVRSGNDASAAVAEHVAGSESSFVELMNERAEELGLTDTHFVNASGLTNDPEHRASPLDLARLAHHAMAHPVFAEFAGAARADVPGLGPMVNRNELLGRYEGATGVKTGYTRLAGLCLVASATRDGRTLYAVVLGSDQRTATAHFSDVAALLDHGFEAYRRAEPVPAEAEATRYRWADADVGLVLGAPLGATIAVDRVVTWRTFRKPVVQRPVPAGATAGRAQLLVDGAVLEEVPLLTADAVGPGGAERSAARAGAALQEALRAFVHAHPVERAA